MADTRPQGLTLLSSFYQGYLAGGGSGTLDQFTAYFDGLRSQFIAILGDAGSADISGSQDKLYQAGMNLNGMLPSATDLTPIVDSIRQQIDIPSSFDDLVSAVWGGTGDTVSQVTTVLGNAGQGVLDAAKNTTSLIQFLPYIALIGGGAYLYFRYIKK